MNSCLHLFFLLPFVFIFSLLPRDRLDQECDHHDVQEVNTTLPFT